MSLERKIEDSDVRYISIPKLNQVYIVKYERGKEGDVIDAVAAMAKDPKIDFDWLDAAVMCYSLGRDVEEEMNKIDH